MPSNLWIERFCMMIRSNAEERETQMKMQYRMLTAVLLVALLGSWAVWADEDAVKARAILDKNKQAVATVKLVVKQKFSMLGMGSEENESKMDITGTVIGPDGLIVVALSSTDPMAIYQSMMSGMMDDEGFQMNSELSDVKILAEDGSEIPAQVVLRDNDLDLAFVRPKDKPATPVAHVDLNDAAKPELLDKLVALNRLGKVANRAYSLSYEWVEAIVERPRTFYVPGSQITNSAQGSPVFSLDGKIVGVIVVRAIKDSDGGGGLFGQSNSVMPIILPAADILEGALQAPPFGEAAAEAAETTNNE